MFILFYCTRYSPGDEIPYMSNKKKQIPFKLNKILIHLNSSPLINIDSIVISFTAKQEASMSSFGIIFRDNLSCESLSCEK